MIKNDELKLPTISSLQGRSLGPYRIDLDMNPMKSRQGWTHFSLFLQERTGKEAVRKFILEGIHSEGGRNVIGWMEVGNYFPIHSLETKEKKASKIDLGKESLDQKLFQLLSRCIPAGGHFMFAYEIFYESSLHEETLIGLSRNIPPVCTPQGMLLFYSGFRFIKNWYLSEGGFEGPSKLWAEKPLDKEDLHRLDLKTFYEILSFLSQNPEQQRMSLDLSARKRALKIMAELNLRQNISPLKKKIIVRYRKVLNSKQASRAAQQTCQLIKKTVRTSHFKDKQMKENLYEISKNCLESFKRG